MFLIWPLLRSKVGRAVLEITQAQKLCGSQRNAVNNLSENGHLMYKTLWSLKDWSHDNLFFFLDRDLRTSTDDKGYEDPDERRRKFFVVHQKILFNIQPFCFFSLLRTSSLLSLNCSILEISGRFSAHMLNLKRNRFVLYSDKRFTPVYMWSRLYSW